VFEATQKQLKEKIDIRFPIPWIEAIEKLDLTLYYTPYKAILR